MPTFSSSLGPSLGAASTFTLLLARIRRRLKQPVKICGAVAGAGGRIARGAWRGVVRTADGVAGIAGQRNVTVISRVAGAGSPGEFAVGITGTEVVSSGKGLDWEPLEGVLDGALAGGFGALGAAFFWDESLFAGVCACSRGEATQQHAITSEINKPRITSRPAPGITVPQIPASSDHTSMLRCGAYLALNSTR